MNPYEAFANAIIVQAVEDYQEVLHFLKLHPHTLDLDTEEAMMDKQKRAEKKRIEKKEGERDEIESFFHSGWFAFLTDLDGDILMRKVRDREVG